MSNQSDQRNFLAGLFILLLFAGSMANYIDRALLGMVIPQVRRDLSLTNADYGLAVHAFLVMYAIFYILGGRIADYLGYRRTFTLALVFWSIASMAEGFVRGLRTLVFCQAVLGMGEGSYYPSAMRGAAERFPPASRAKAVGTILSAISVGLLVTPPVVAWTTLHYGWRATFLLIGALGFLLLPPWIWLHRRTDVAPVPPSAGPARAPTSRGATSDGAPVPQGTGPTQTEAPDAATGRRRQAGIPGEEDIGLSAVLKTRKYWCVLLARGCSDAAWYFYLFWIPGYFQEARGFNLATVGRLLWIPYSCSAVGAIAGAAASSALIQRGLGLDRSRKTILFTSALVCVLSATAGFAPAKYVALALVSLALFAHQSWSSNIHTVITEISPAKHVATLYGITGATGTLIGAAAQLVIGPVIDLHGYKPAFVWVGGMYLLAMVLLSCAGPLQPVRAVTSDV
jgi:ACS family hexuronate transporter-like MFS transporter